MSLRNLALIDDPFKSVKPDFITFWDSEISARNSNVHRLGTLPIWSSLLYLIYASTVHGALYAYILYVLYVFLRIFTWELKYSHNL